MKCSERGCRNKAVYVIVDGYIAGERKDSITLLQDEIMVFNLCREHDGLFHAFMSEHKSQKFRIKIKEG